MTTGGDYDFGRLVGAITKEEFWRRGSRLQLFTSYVVFTDAFRSPKNEKVNANTKYRLMGRRPGIGSDCTQYRSAGARDEVRPTG